MTTAHAAFQFIAGDDWEIRATLLDETGTPYNLTGATIKWTLTSGGGQAVLKDGDYSISIVDAAAGICLIHVLAAKSTTVAGGQYKDALRIVSGGVTSTLSMGVVYVIADPWAVQSGGALRLVA